MKALAKIFSVFGLLFALLLTYPAVRLHAQDTSENSTRTSFVAWHPDGTRLALADRDQVLILDADTLIVSNSFLVTKVQYTAPAWSPDGALLAFGNGSDLEIWTESWDSDSAKQVAVLSHDEASGFGTISALAWSPDGQRLASARGGYIKVWDTTTWESLKFLGGDWEIQCGIAWSPSGDWFALASKGGSVAIFNAQTYKRIAAIGFLASVHPDGYIGNPAALTVTWTADEQSVVVGSTDGTLRIVANKPISPVLQMESDATTQILHAHQGEVLSVVWRPGSAAEVASAASDGTITVRDLSTGQIEATFQVEPPGQLWSIAWSPDGTRLAYGTPDQSVAFLDVPVAVATTPTAKP